MRQQTSYTVSMSSLTELQVVYALTSLFEMETLGGVAVTIHGATRATDGLDIDRNFLRHVLNNPFDVWFRPDDLVGDLDFEPRPGERRAAVKSSQPPARSRPAATSRSSTTRWSSTNSP